MYIYELGQLVGVVLLGCLNNDWLDSRLPPRFVPSLDLRGSFGRFLDEGVGETVSKELEIETFSLLHCGCKCPLDLVKVEHRRTGQQVAQFRKCRCQLVHRWTTRSYPACPMAAMKFT